MAKKWSRRQFNGNSIKRALKNARRKVEELERMLDLSKPITRRVGSATNRRWEINSRFGERRTGAF